MVQQWAHDIRSGFYKHNSKKEFHIMFYQSIFSLQKIKRTARKKLYYLLLISKFEGILHILKFLEITCNFDRYIPFLQTSLWKFKETRHCTTWYWKRRCFEFWHIMYVICRNISEIYLKISYAYNSTICDINRLSE